MAFRLVQGAVASQKAKRLTLAIDAVLKAEVAIEASASLFKERYC
jgi:hypothetical protein